MRMRCSRERLDTCNHVERLKLTRALRPSCRHALLTSAPWVPIVVATCPARGRRGFPGAAKAFERCTLACLSHASFPSRKTPLDTEPHTHHKLQISDRTGMRRRMSCRCSRGAGSRCGAGAGERGRGPASGLTFGCKCCLVLLPPGGQPRPTTADSWKPTTQACALPRRPRPASRPFDAHHDNG